MRLIRMFALAGLCGVLCLTMGTSGCKIDGGNNTGDLLDLSASRSSLFYWGHSTFSVTSADGHVLLFDPYNPTQTGYPQYQVAPDVILISHEHYDHNDTSWSIGDPQIVHGLDASGEVRDLDFTSAPFHIWSVASKHYSDPADAANGNNTIFVVEVDGVRIVHLGDLGQTSLDATQLTAIGTPAFLLVPVGGGPTINGATAADIVAQIDPIFALPMHYRTAATVAPLSTQIGTVQDFIDAFPTDPVTIAQNGITLDYSGWVQPSTSLMLLNYLPN
jgi:L-ascorbate metabolism protein UlaG (beta-lactamase superfamily)